MKNTLLFLFFYFIVSLGYSNAQTELKVLQWNIWQEGTVVPGGYDAIVEEISRLNPDFVTFSEVRNYDGTRFCDRIVQSLRQKGKTYYSFLSYDSGLLSKYPIKDSTTVYPLKDDHGSIYRMLVSVGGQNIAVYTAHLDYLSDAYYNVRGYDGSTWKEIPKPETIHEVLTVNDASFRDDAIREFVRFSRKDIDEGNIVILGGDFNEPSHLDWTRETKDLYDHNGMIIPWTVPLILDNSGFVDAYRAFYPNVLDYPGFTFPSDNEKVPVNKLTWAPKSDERDRIDYIFYYPHRRLELKDAVIFGPKGSIMKSQRVKEISKDPFIEPLGTWPTDHKGVLVTFRLKDQKSFDKRQEQYKLVWEDNFDGNKFQEKYWSKIPRGGSDWCRHMSDEESLYEVKDGNLILRGKVNDGIAPNDTAPYITGGLYTKDKMTIRYGKVEVRAKLQGAKGAWPAIWMLANDEKWPDGGEIDLMERLNHDTIAYQTVHSYYTHVLNEKTNPKQGGIAPIDPDGYNTYAVEILPDKLILSINGIETITYPKIETDKKGQFPFGIPSYLLIDMQIEGSWVGKADPKDYPIEMQVDWVRFYEYK